MPDCSSEEKSFAPAYNICSKYQFLLGLANKSHPLT